ncbi:type II toxin-antitoxin system VapC family toxin [Gordonia westfalica]|uniref:PIN domain nuclease, a component of toxin-antitoxin system (PIN domain) n=1 Tax=Gordonia westfalica TaxID=158898 RepID=A0A1H2KWN7_9ACTN|nr:MULTISPECIES: type II toxin-antitoxin system VapC family toxin [Gordonia]ASR05379.1 PIN domain protein [Gordonia rubripertincta]MDS1113393.1 type II toxin-antitoxin system VapC family toxin [Gordonia westfalica]SDU73177.1 PIN domain nuclease, a component of toxin-antitoxin system (PIN domain) [Gordonia westfalica]
MTDILLDTNALLWLVTDPDRLAPSALDILGDPANNLYVSAASAWEIAIKTRLGRLDAGPLLSSWSETIAAMAAMDLPIDAIDGAHAGQLVWDHRDPFDRMIVAQATRRGLTIATSDKAIHRGTLVPVIDTRR